MKFRANWRLSGLKGKDLQPGDTIDLTAEEAAPYIGGVLSPVEKGSKAEASVPDTAAEVTPPDAGTATEPAKSTKTRKPRAKKSAADLGTE